jgi:hypothetical protein
VSCDNRPTVPDRDIRSQTCDCARSYSVSALLIDLINSAKPFWVSSSIWR